MYRVKSYSGLKQASKELSTVSGYASIFNNIDADNEMIMPGAFSKSLKERGPGSSTPRIKHLWMHKVDMPIGIPTDLKEDGTGLYFDSKFGTDSFSQDKLTQHADGIITEFSIGFNVIKSEKATGEAGEYTRLTELKLWEYSSVTWGANSLTHITEIKGMKKEDQIKSLNDRMDKLIKGMKGNYSEETKEQFEIEYKQIQEVINSLLKEPSKDTPESEESTQIDEKIFNILKQIKF